MPYVYSTSSNDFFVPFCNGSEITSKDRTWNRKISPEKKQEIMKANKIDNILNLIKSEDALQSTRISENHLDWIPFLILVFLAYIDIIGPKVAVILSLAFAYSLPTYSSSGDIFYYYYKKTAAELYLSDPVVLFVFFILYFLYEYLFTGWYTSIYWMYIVINLFSEVQYILYNLFVKFVRSKNNTLEFIYIGQLNKEKANSIIEKIQVAYNIQIEKINIPSGLYMQQKLSK